MIINNNNNNKLIAIAMTTLVKIILITEKMATITTKSHPSIHFLL